MASFLDEACSTMVVAGAAVIVVDLWFDWETVLLDKGYGSIGVLSDEIIRLKDDGDTCFKESGVCGMEQVDDVEVEDA